MYGLDNSGLSQRPGPPRWRWVVMGAGIALVVIVIVVVLLLANGTIGSGGTGPRPLFGFYGGFLLLLLLLMVGFFVIRVAFWSSRRGRGYYGRPYGPPGMRRDPAVMAARQRYARGEITREQYDQIMTDLGRRGRGPGGPLSGG
jgi:uncharacterized membrane protein